MGEREVNMSIINVRIDDRLIHGQVANLWITSIKPSRVMVIDNEASTNDMQKRALKMATPAGTALSVLSLDKARTNILAGNYDNQKVMIVVRRPDYLKNLVDGGIKLPEVIVGCMPKVEGVTRKLSKTIDVSDNDIQIFKYLEENGIRVVAQAIPSNVPKDILSLIK